MGKIKSAVEKSTAAKILIFMIILAVAYPTTLGTASFAVNMALDNYGKTDKLIQKELCLRTANEAAIEIMDESGLYSYDGGPADNSYIVENIGEKGIFNNENQMTEFGYAFYPVKNKKVDRKNPIYIVNESLAKKTMDSNMTLYVEEHEKYQLEVFVQNPSAQLGPYYSGELPDELIVDYNCWLKMVKYRYIAIAAMLIGAAIMLFLGILLIAATGKNNRFVKYLPLDLLILFTVILIELVVYFASSSFGSLNDMILLHVGAATGVVISGLLGVTVLLITARVKQKHWWRSSLIYQFCRLVKKLACSIYTDFLVKIPSVWAAALAALAFITVNIIVCGISYSSPIFLLIESVLIFAGAVLTAVRFKKLREGSRRIAGGEYDYVVDTKGLLPGMKPFAEDLNSIRKGVEIAVEEQTKSERMRNELITNVSHDIRTPLTSIINYVDLLKKETEGSGNENIAEYVEVLERQSGKLKNLTDNLIEASKAASGSLKLDIGSCNLGVLISQLSGEYAETASEAELELITELPDHNLSLMLDGQCMYRVLSNLMDNICKYSQPGTRVYQKLEDRSDKIIISYRNTSKYELNISADELVERFVRGDSSRHTEGSGLGLSIARNLVELQGGKFDIVIDGDLFKVIIEFDK